MKISYNWLQSYFQKKLPTPEVVADGLIFHSFEVEDILATKTDTVFDIKILPDRAHDCLCHLGIAREISAIFGAEDPKIEIKELGNSGIDANFSIDVKDTKNCRRYIGRVVRNINVKESDEAIRIKLETIGQRTINNIVDAANYVMFETGQPLHAFDLDKIKGVLCIRMAKKGENIETLDGRMVELAEDNLVIADDEGPLAIAGVKGGSRAGVTKETKNILLESANFDPVNIRRTATKLNIHTDASKRFENDLSEETALVAIKLFSGLIAQNGAKSDTIFEDIIDIYGTKRDQKKVDLLFEDIEKILGIKIEENKIIEILNKLGIVTLKNNEKITALIPYWRIDLNIKEDIAEEVGRIYGYEKIPELLPIKSNISSQNKNYLVSNKIKEILFVYNFSEIMNYSFEDNGEIEVLSPLASDKGFLRKNIFESFEKKIDFNLKNEIFVDSPVKIFEIGNVFLKEGESQRLCIGIGYKTKKLNKGKRELDEVLTKIFDELSIKENIKPIGLIEKETYTIAEFELSDFVKNSEVFDFSLDSILGKNIVYKKISEYPRVIRDIALFVPPEVEPVLVSEIIEKNSGPLLFGDPILFDVFDKKDEQGNITRRSLAFRMIFQSYERTLSDEEINKIILNIISKLEEKNWEVRK